MRKKSLILPFVLLLPITFGCNNPEKEANARLERANILYEKDEIIAARNELDTIRLHHPENPTIMKATLELTCKIELKEAARNIAYCDSILPSKLSEAKQLTKAFILEKNEQYQNIGNYVHKSQSIEKNIERSHLRCGVNERGEIYITSIYFGTSPINHTAITLSNLQSGISASTTPIPYDGGQNYRFKDLGNIYENITYKNEKCIDAVKFIYTNRNEKIKATYTGGKTYSIILDETTKRNIASTYELATILSDIDRLSREKEIAIQKKAYLDKKMNHN
jgi:hypothetical protein